MKRIAFAAALLLCSSFAFAQVDIKVLDRTEDGPVIGRALYAQEAGALMGQLSAIAGEPDSGEKALSPELLAALAKMRLPLLEWPLGSDKDRFEQAQDFLALCAALNCEAFVVGQLGNLTLRELVEWIGSNEAGKGSPARVSYFCPARSQAMSATQYAAVFAHYMRSLCAKDGPRPHLLYSCPDDGLLQSAASVSADMYRLAYAHPAGETYAASLGAAVELENKIRSAPAVPLYLDKWGSGCGTMQDVIAAALCLNVLHKYSDRVRLSSFAPIVSDRDALIVVGQDGSIRLSPAYHLFEMYSIFQDARYVAVENNCPWRSEEARVYPALDLTAAVKDGHLLVAVVNTDRSGEIRARMSCASLYGSHIKARVLKDDGAAPQNFFSYKRKDGKLEFTIPAMSVLTFELY